MTKYYIRQATTFSLCMFVLISICLPHFAWASVAGKFQFVSGDVSIVSVDGTRRAAIKGGEVNEKESIHSGKNGSAQLHMIDDGIVAVRPETVLQIDEYKFTNKEDGKDRSFFSLLKGGFRSITGLIGRANKDNYRIQTNSATIGIRGTDHETIHLTVAQPNLPEGTYNKVNTGATVVNGTLVGANQVAYAPNLNAPTVILPNIPPIFETPKGGQQGKDERKQQNADKKDGKQQAADGKKSDAGQKPKNGEAQPAPGEKTALAPGGETQSAPAPAPGDNTPPAPAPAPAPAGSTPSAPAPAPAPAGSTLSAPAPAPAPGDNILPTPAPTPAPAPAPAPVLPPAPLPPPPPPPTNLIGSALLPPPPPPTTTLITDTTGSSAVAPSGGTVPAPIGTGGVGGDISIRSVFNGTTNVTGAAAGGGSIVVEGSNQTILFDTTTHLPVLVAEQGPNGGMKYSAGTAKMIEGGQTTVGTAKVMWGRYVGADQFVDSMGTRDPISMSLMFTNQAMSFIQANGYFQTNSHTFNIVPNVGNVVDNLGATYTATGTLNVTASASPSVSLSINASNASKNWSLNYSGTLQSFYQKNCGGGACGLALTSGTLTGASIIKGEAGGVFIGPNAAAVLTSYSANAFGAGGALIGSLQGTSLLNR